MVPNHPLQATTRMGSDSAMRHLTQIAMGDTSEDHWAAVAWQAFAAMHFQEMIALGVLPKELDDIST